MKRLLISCVGNQDPFSYRKEGKSYDEAVNEQIASARQGKDGPVISFCEKFKLKRDDSLILLYTKSAKNVLTPTEKSAVDTKKFICSQYNIDEENIRLISLNTPYDNEFNPSDPVMALDYIRQSLQDALTDEDEKLDTCIISSSGTPQMQAAWVLLIHSGFIKARFFQANSNEIKLEPLFEDQLLIEACNLIRIGNFGSVTEILKNLSAIAISKSRREVFFMLTIAAEGYRLWTGFEYQKATREFSGVIKNLNGYLTHLSETERVKLNRLTEMLSEHLKFLNNVLNSVELRLLDIYQSAERHYFQKSYVEAVWRLDVVCDLALIETSLRAINRKYRIRLEAENFYTEVNNSNLSELKDLVKKIKKKSFYKDLRESQAQELLAEIEPDVLRSVDGIRRDLLAEMRNTAVHYAKPIYKAQVSSGLGIARDFIEIILDKQIISDETHPLAKKNLQEIAIIFREIGVGRF